jgi:hypothetical protein
VDVVNTHAMQPLAPSAWSADEYRAYVAEAWPRYRESKVAAETVRLRDEYVAHLPLWLLGRCPFCGGEVAERIDTFSLNGLGWEEPATGYGWLRGRNTVRPLGPGCAHLRIVAWFLHLERRVPDDLFPGKVVRTGPEVPSIMRVPMRAPDAIAVLHALPVSRWEDDVLTHRYTLRFMSYFTQSVETFEEATRDWGVHYGRIEYDEVDYDLGAWAEKGRLHWITPAGELASAATATDFEPSDDDAVWPHGGLIDGDHSTERILTRTGVTHPKPDLISRLMNRLGR